MVSTKELLEWCLKMEYEVNSLILKHINTVEHVRTLQGYDQYTKRLTKIQRRHRLCTCFFLQ